MNKTLHNLIKKQNILYFFRDYSKKEKDCECPSPPPSKYIEEKRCSCCFEVWIPKSRKQIAKQLIKEKTKEKKPRKCYAGMVDKRPTPTCRSQKFDPFKKLPCKKDKDEGPKDKQSTSTEPKFTVPKPDWQYHC